MLRILITASVQNTEAVIFCIFLFDSGKLVAKKQFKNFLATQNQARKGRETRMRRNRNDNTKKERIIMIASSVFVLTALTMTGVYMQARDRESENDGYTIDFTALESNVDDKYQEIAQNNPSQDGLIGNLAGMVNGVVEDDLDYMPLAAGSGQVEIPGLTGNKFLDEVDTDNNTLNAADTNSDTLNAADTDNNTLDAADIPDADVTQALSVNEAETSVDPEDMDPVDPPAETSKQTIPKEQPSTSDSAVVNQELHFAESEGLIRPLSGETVIPFSTESSAYFATLDLYKYSRAMVISAPEGTAVSACADGKVTNIFEDSEIGHAVTMDLGDGYEITYGQLRDIRVALGSYVNAGDTVGSIEKPTKYYVCEGSNLYLKLTAGGTPVNPEPLFK